MSKQSGSDLCSAEQVAKINTPEAQFDPLRCARRFADGVQSVTELLPKGSRAAKLITYLTRNTCYRSQNILSHLALIDDNLRQVILDTCRLSAEEKMLLAKFADELDEEGRHEESKERRMSSIWSGP